jgi:hemolysin III
VPDDKVDGGQRTLEGGHGIQSAGAELAAVVQPRLRGWLHAGAAPLVLVAGIALVALAPPGTPRFTSAVYAATALNLFATSAVYHRFRWGPRAVRAFKRLDHANIYLIIAGSYTPMTALALTGTTRTALLWVVWTGALAGVLFRVLWVTAPRALYTVLYVALGWSALFALPEIFAGAGVAVAVLTLVGGACYTLGGLVYGLRRPDPWPRWFGFHEIFHALTIAAWTCQYIAISMLVYGH